MLSNEEKERFEKSRIKPFLDEKIFPHSYLYTIYNLFVNICKTKEYKITPQILFDLFYKISQTTNTKYEEHKIGIYYLQIDIDKDGIVSYYDFIKFITTLMKFTYNEIYYKKGINLLTSFSISDDKKLFVDIVSNLFSNLVNCLNDNSNINNINIPNININPFTYYDLSLKFLPFYKYYCMYKNEINIESYYNSQKKLNEFNQMLINYTNIGYITELQNLLNSTNTTEYYKGLSLFKKSIKPLNYINNQLLMVIYHKNIFLFLTVVIKGNILNKVLMIFNIINDKNYSPLISPEVVYTLLVILRRILNLFVYLNDIYINCCENDNKCFDHYIKEDISDFKELSTLVNTKILSPLSNNYNYFYTIFELKTTKSPSLQSKVKFVMYQLILLSCKIKYEYYSYFLTNTNYLDWLTYDIKENLDIYTRNKNNLNTINNLSNINAIEDENNRIDYNTIENVVYNCINIIDITLKYEKDIKNDNNNNIRLLFIKNLYSKLLLLINNMQEIIFNNDYDLILNNDTLLNNQKNNISDEPRIPLKSKYICLLGLLNCLNINENNNIIIGVENPKIKEFENSKFILQIYNDEFISKYKELTMPFCFYLKSLIINDNKQILSIISGLDIINHFFNYYSSNLSNSFYSFSTFTDFCEVILNYSEPKTLINNSNIITAIISIINKMLTDNSNNNKLIGDIGIKNKLIGFLSKITDLNNANINEEIINIPSIYNIIISYMMNNFYYIEEVSHLNKRGIIFNIFLIEAGLNIINNIFSTNSNSYEKILKHFNFENLDILANLFDKISLLWEIDDRINVNLDEEEIKNKYLFDKFKDIPKNNLLIEILSIYDNLLEYEERYQLLNNNYNSLFEYIKDIDINIRIKLNELKIYPNGIEQLPTLIINTEIEQSEEIIEKEKYEKYDKCFQMNIDGISFYRFYNEIRNGYQSDVYIFYRIKKNNNIIKREIKDEKDFQLFIQEILEAYDSQPNKDNCITANLQIKLKEKYAKIKRKCINCGQEFETELDIEAEKFEELKGLRDIQNLNEINQLLEDAKPYCYNCEKLNLEVTKHQVNILNSQNKINELSGLNLTNLNLSELPYQNIIAQNALKNNLNNNNTNDNILLNTLINNNALMTSLMNNSNLMSNLMNNTNLTNNNSILSTSLFNRTLNPQIRLNNFNNNNQNSNLFGLNGINNISAISPRTPRRNNTFNISSTSNVQNYRVLERKLFQ